jgi:hypothetical protein
LIVVTRLSDGTKPVRLELDSGANVALLYNAHEFLDLGLTRKGVFIGGGANGAKRYYSA